MATISKIQIGNKLYDIMPTNHAVENSAAIGQATPKKYGHVQIVSAVGNEKWLESNTIYKTFQETDGKGVVPSANAVHTAYTTLLNRIDDRAGVTTKAKVDKEGNITWEPILGSYSSPGQLKYKTLKEVESEIDTIFHSLKRSHYASDSDVVEELGKLNQNTAIAATQVACRLYDLTHTAVLEKNENRNSFQKDRWSGDDPFGPSVKVDSDKFNIVFNPRLKSQYNKMTGMGFLILSGGSESTFELTFTPKSDLKAGITYRIFNTELNKSGLQDLIVRSSDVRTTAVTTDTVGGQWVFVLSGATLGVYYQPESDKTKETAITSKIRAVTLPIYREESAYSIGGGAVSVN